MCNEERRNSENGKKVSNCVWKECVKCFLFDEYNFPVGFWVNCSPMVGNKKLVYLFFVVACCVMPFYLETNNEKVMNKFQWFFGISTWSHDSMGIGGRGGKRMKVNYNRVYNSYQLATLALASLRAREGD